MERLAPPPTEAPPGKGIHPAFLHKTYEVTRRIGRIGTTFDITDDQGNFLLRTSREILRFTNNFHVYGEKERENELLSFKTRGSIPQTYDIEDPSGKKKIGSIRHNLAQSFPRTSWDILTPEGAIVGTLKRNRINKSWHRYGAKALLYPSFDITDADGNVVSTIRQKFSVIGLKYKMDIQEGAKIDPRILVAANVVVAEREFRREKD